VATHPPTQAGDLPSDPAEINTPEQLAAALDRLRCQAGFASRRSLTTAAGRRGLVLPRSTVDDALHGRRIPSDATLQSYLAVCGVT
jgi:hypothetical protein